MCPAEKLLCFTNRTDGAGSDRLLSSAANSSAGDSVLMGGGCRTVHDLMCVYRYGTIHW
jgi:hypothetical protein